jgi:outer membrane receptor for ferrienterochelin and colicins
VQLTAAILLVVVPLAPAKAAAQANAAASGVLRGTVRDGHGDAVRGAVVGVPGTTLYTQSDPSGRYRLAPLPAGEVRVRVAAIGYLPATTTVAVALSDSAVADFTLQSSPLELTPLDVVSTKIPRFGERPATSVTQVNEREIDRRAVNTIDEAIDKAAGIQFLNGQINIRGSSGYVQGLNSRVLMLVDGVPMNQGDRGGINWDLLPIDQIERVDILKGAGSSLYGSAALGGVVNLTTRDVPEGVHGRVRLTGGVYGDPPHAEWQFRNGPGLQGGGDVAASYGTATFGGRLAAGARHSDGYREQDTADHWQIAGKARWQAGRARRTRVDLSGAWAVDRYEVPLSWCSRGECDDRGQVYQPFKVDTTERGARTDSRKGYLAAQVRSLVSERLAWQARASWLRTHFIDVRRSATEFGIANRFGTEGRLEAHPDSARTVLVGGEATFSDVTSDIFGAHSQSEFAAYGQSEQPIASLRVHAGARLDFLAVDGGSLTAVVSPRIGATLANFRGSIGRGFRAPTMAERFVQTVALGFEVIPNPNLRPETAWSFELGHITAPLLRVLRIDAALFWTEARDLIEPTLVLDSAGTPQIQLQNLARARIAGLDATVLAAPFSDRLTTTLGYTYLSTRRRTEGQSDDAPLAFRPGHLLTVTADYTLHDFGIGADLRYASRPARIELEGFVDPRRVAVKVLDLRAGWERGPLALRLLVANAFNYIYNLVPETLAPVRTITLTAVWSY